MQCDCIFWQALFRSGSHALPSPRLSTLRRARHRQPWMRVRGGHQAPESGAWLGQAAPGCLCLVPCPFHPVLPHAMQAHP